MKEIAIFFPGIGYGNEKPLLHYCQKLFKERNIEIKKIEWKDFDTDSKSDKEKLLSAIENSLAQTKNIFSNFDFSKYSKIYLVGKSIGTVSSAYLNEQILKKLKIDCQMILFTPLEKTFDYLYESDKVLIFHGTRDPYLSDEIFNGLIQKKKCETILIENANHSLETEDVLQDIQTALYVMERVKEWIFDQKV